MPSVRIIALHRNLVSGCIRLLLLVLGSHMLNFVPLFRYSVIPLIRCREASLLCIGDGFTKEQASVSLCACAQLYRSKQLLDFHRGSG